MTRKKSNVKALALAVTCAILAGGYSGLNPVYAADGDVTYDATNKVLKVDNSSSQETIYEINGVKLGYNSNTTGGGVAPGRIEATSLKINGAATITDVFSVKSITSIDDTLDINGVKFDKNYGSAILKNNTKIGDIVFTDSTMTYTPNGGSAVSVSMAEMKNAITAVGNSGMGLVKDVTDLKGTVGNADTANTLAYNTQKITYDATDATNPVTKIDGKTMAGNVTLDSGAVTGVKSINASNDNFYVAADGAVKANSIGVGTEGTAFGVATDGSVTANGGIRTTKELSSQTLTVGSNAFTVANDGSLKAAYDKFQVNADGELVDNAGKKVTISQLAADSANVGGITRDDANNTTTIEGKVKIKNDGSVTFNEGEAQQVIINNEGIKVGTGSAYINNDGFSVGEPATSKNKLTKDGLDASAMHVSGVSGSLNVADVSTTSTMIYTKDTDGTNTIWMDPATGNISTNGTLQVGGGVDGTTPKVTIDGTTGSVRVGKDGSEMFGVDGETGNVATKGSLTVAGTSNFTGETTFSGGIKTDTISEATADKGVTVDGVLLKDKGITAADGKFSVDGATGNTTVGGTLGVTGATTLNDALTVKGTAKFGAGTGAETTIIGDLVKTGRIETGDTQASKISNVTLDSGVITATTIKATTISATNYNVDNLTVNQKLQVGTTGKTTLIDGTLQLDTDEDKKLDADKLDNLNKTIKPDQAIAAKSANIGGVKFSTTGEMTDVKNITAEKGTIGQVVLEGGKVTAANGGNIGGVIFDDAGNITTNNGEIKAESFKVDDDNYFNSNGITAKKGGTIGAATINETTLTVGSTKLDNTEGITTNKLEIGSMTLTGTSLDTGTADFQINGVKFNQGQVTAAADKGFVTGNSLFKQGSLIVSDSNKLETGNGLTVEKAKVNGTLDVTGEATFGTTNNQTKINGNIITTDTLKANKLILGAEGTPTIEVDKDGSFKAANGKFEVSKEGALKAANGAFYVNENGKTNFTKDADNLSSINGGNIWAKATDAAANASSEMLHTYKGLKVSGTKSGKKSSFEFDTETGIGTFTGQDNTTTTINGSKIISTANDATTGSLVGNHLELKKDDNNLISFKDSVANFTKDGNTTTISGDEITTKTLNVDVINLGEGIYDTNGTPVGSNLSMDKDGNFSAAGGNFTVIGGSGADKGAMTNTVGNTTLKTDTNGASMSYDNSAATGGVKSEVSVGKNAEGKTSAKMSTDTSFIEVKKDGITDKVGNTTVETKDGSFSVKDATTGKGMDIDTSTGKTTFTGADYSSGESDTVKNGKGTTTIDGNTITTGKLITDQLVIKGDKSGDTSSDGGESGSIAFGGDGTITSNIKGETGTPDEGKETTFKTNIDGTTTTVTDGTTTTTNEVTASGNTNTVKDVSGNNSSKFTQTTTSIGCVVTNGKVSMRQELTTDGLKISDDKDAPDTNYTQITNKDVSITNPQNSASRINLSDLGSLGDLNEEITSRDEYTSNKTAVGAINAEAGIRREEVARLDGRINDVNDRVNKVGAMAAAIASLKSIGYDPQAPSEFSIGLGQYKGETGVAMGFFHYPNKNFMINVSLSTAGGETMGGIGATWRFGHKSPQKLLDEQRAAQAKKELAAAEKYQAAAKLAKEAQERAEYAAKLARQAQVSADNAKAAADATQAKHF